MSNDGKQLRKTELGVLKEIMSTGSPAEVRHLLTGGMSDLCCGSTKLVGSVTFWLLGGMMVKIMTTVSNARKGGSEQWVKMKK